MATMGRCYRDRPPICIFVDTEKRMFQRNRKVYGTPMYVASNFLGTLISLVKDIPGFQDVIDLYIGKTHVHLESIGTTSRVLDRMLKEAKYEDNMYTFWTRKIRGKSMEAIRYIILTHRKVRVPYTIQKKTLVLDFDVMANAPYTAINSETRYSQIYFRNYLKAVNAVYYTNIMPYYFTCLSGAHHMMGTMYGRMFNSYEDPSERKYNLMTVPEITIIGVGKPVRDFQRAGHGVFQVWGGPLKFGMQMFAENGNPDDPETMEKFSNHYPNQMNEYMASLHEAVMAVDTIHHHVLYGCCKELNSNKDLLVVFRPAPDSFGPGTWRHSLKHIKDFDTCTTNDHGSVKENPNAEKFEELDNWFHGSSTINIEFFYWNGKTTSNIDYFWPNDVNHKPRAPFDSRKTIAHNASIIQQVMQYCNDNIQEKQQVAKFFMHPYPDISSRELEEVVRRDQEPRMGSPDYPEEDVDAFMKTYFFPKPQILQIPPTPLIPLIPPKNSPH